MIMETDTLLYIYRHLFLPLQLPQEDDFRAEWESILLQATIDGLQSWRECMNPAHRELADAAICTIQNMQRAYSSRDGTISEFDILGLLKDLTEDRALPLLVKKQNAGVLISRSNDSVLFELFEISPSNKAILAAKGRLRRHFPGAAVVIGINEFQQPDFQMAIAQTLADMSMHVVEAMQPKVKKAGDYIAEDRDTNHPGMVCEVLHGVLRSIGEPVACPAIVKNMRDDVLWSDARSPWRRSPVWLLIRVALQLGFKRKTAPSETDAVYKEAMLLILCHILKLATKQPVPSEALFSMNAKLSRRLLKIGSVIRGEVLRYVQEAMKDAHAVVSQRWLKIQDMNAKRIGLQKLSKLDFVNDTHVSIPQLDEYIIWRNNRKREHRSGSFQPSSALMTFRSHDLPQLPSAFPNESKDEAIANLEAFETWVSNHSRQWSQDNLQIACRELKDIIALYHRLALPYYTNNPEALSIMVLTILELWIACDEAVVTDTPLLKQYKPGISSGVLQNLLLPFASQMRRLFQVEKYLANRSSSARLPPNELYYAVDSPECFPARFFDQSPYLQGQHREIVRRAEKEKRAKITEWRNLRMQYNDLITKADVRGCEYEEVYIKGLYDYRHSPDCDKCEYERQAEALSIAVNEWPLPRNNTHEKTVIFELFIPESIQSWRQSTFYVLRDIIGMQYSNTSSSTSRYSLENDPHLPCGPSSSSYIGLLSETKPNVVTHRKEKQISTAKTEAAVCLNNGLNYRYFDSKGSQFVETLIPTDKIPQMCTYYLPECSQNLQKYLFRPERSHNGPAPNVVFADQSEAPTHMSIEETKDLATLPLGHRIQFHNILVQLVAPSLDFKKDETAIFLLQCLYQVGPRGDTPLRASHEVFNDPRFSSCLLENVAAAWSRVRENWESAQALVVFAAITTRVLSLASSQNIQQRCLELLSALRTGAFAWVELLRDKSHKAITHDDRTYLRSKSVDIALICAACFDVEDEHLSNILKSDSDASIFVQCSILIQEGKRVHDPESELTLACLSLRFRRLLYRSSSILAVTHSGISNAVKKAWSAYRPGGSWRAASNTTHWLVTETAANCEGISLQVHYSLLSGELLVNGIPLSRPPTEYESHPMWPTLFGPVAVEVMPTSVVGMQFSAKRQHQGYDTHFGLNKSFSDNTDLLVQASKSSMKYETIPARLLQGIFPDHFIRDFVHWYDCINDTIEFRSRAAPWDETGTVCVLSRFGEGWRLTKGGSAVLGLNSTTVNAIANVLSPLAKKFDIHVLKPLDKSSLEIEIPMLRLGFFLTSGESKLRSREFRGMSVDDDQSLGTLIGFANKLILKHKNRRLVLVPEGLVSWSSGNGNGHIRVKISRPSITKVHTLEEDRELWRLIDKGDLQGKLFLSYLHALTSYCLPDPLTNRTGVEQSLWTLNSASVRSFGSLSKSNIETLVLIAELTPRREYYPPHEQEMQTISWVDSLSYLSQHDGFYTAVASIFQQAKQNSLFYPDLNTEELDISYHIKTREYLMERDRIRSSTFRISGFGAEKHCTAHDVRYQSRDRNQLSTSGTNAYALSSIIYHDRTTIHTAAPSQDELWEFISHTSTVFGPDATLPVSQLRYSADAANSGLDRSLWLALHKILRTQRSKVNKFSVMMWLSAIAAYKDADMKYLQVLALFFCADELDDEYLPSILSCQPSKGYGATSEQLESIVRSRLTDIYYSPEASMEKHWSESHNDYYMRRYKIFTDNQNSAVHRFVSKLLQQWPSEPPIRLDVERSISDYVQLESIMVEVEECFQQWFNNRRVFHYLGHVERILRCMKCIPLTMHGPEKVTLNPSPRARAFISVSDLFASPAPAISGMRGSLRTHLLSHPREQKAPRLVELINALTSTIRPSQYEKSYVEELTTSMQSLQEQQNACCPDLRDIYSIEYLRQHLDECKKSVEDLYQLLVSKAGIAHNGLLELGHGPRRSPVLFLQQLTNAAWSSLDSGWRACVSRYGLALTALQRAERLLKAAGSRSDDDLIREVNNMGHEQWDPNENPEWLLLEVESSIMIRHVQEQIASEMMHPSSNCNAVMQLNMGEGKSSVIVPMLATKLANRSQLARVIVAKPQSKQMAQMLSAKLGGLLGRRVYHMPFSRALKIDSTTVAATIDNIVRECRDSGGVLLVQPEHLLSFQLLGIECHCSSTTIKQAIGMQLIRTQDFFDNSSRDIVDESDENFSPKFELVYTMGSQRPIEMSPTRWLCIQQVLGLVRSLAADVAGKAPKSIDFDARSDGCFPKVRILKTDAGELLVEKVARYICDKGFDRFPIARQQENVRSAVFKYIAQYSLSQEDINAAEEAGDGSLWTESTKSLLLLLRGILAGGVLTFVLSKRWRVNFGLAGVRTPPTQLAVPYRAKDNPTPRSEFSHPDVVIALTCLTYYYGGLENDDLFVALGHLLNSDQASIEYDAWIKDAPDMPVSFRQLDGLNLKDRPQCINDVFPHLKYGKSVIDYFLGHIVFPKQIKEFPHKLSASGWDIGKTKANLVTGFSGTNDSRNVLPTDVRHLELPSQAHTNALVLEYLLQPENSVTLLPTHYDNTVTDAERFFQTVVNLERPTRVILDVGAQILELDNQQAAQAWLRMVTEDKTQAVVFVNDNDELCVIDRGGRLELLQTSSYSTQLDSCLVFLDDAHTRGIDLKLPDDYRAAVTLGAHLTKDRLVQACMRMRKLGKGQSVVFCVSAEIQTKIEECTALPKGAAIGVKDVLHWAMSETFAETRRNMPLWAAQGDRFSCHDNLWKSAQTNGVTSMSNAHAEKFLEDEAQSIVVRYRPRLAAETSKINKLLHSKGPRTEEIIARYNQFDDLNFNSSTLQEEQERELSPEIEQERQVQRPPPAQPADHFLHHEVEAFITTGDLNPISTAYMPAFDALLDTNAAKTFNVSQLNSGKLFVTKDFARTVRVSGNMHRSDQFQRHVQWILSSHGKESNIIDILLVISPFEAEMLMPRLQSAGPSRATLHLYKPRSHTIYRSFDRLDFFTIPDRETKLEIPHPLVVELNLFCGQLYFSEYADYLETCKFLGLAHDVPREDQVIDTDGYIVRDGDAGPRFKKSPVEFLRVHTSAIRRNGQNISKTHVGSMLNGKPLQMSDIEGNK
ncbi:hypothetical protein F5Y03DRAFT_114674 [Xylaria venustula]|nr:hypothetical protein F5Y03DRAFT_114674 [Xylaria venustula]